MPLALLAAVMAWSANARATRRFPFAGGNWPGFFWRWSLPASAAMAFNRLADRHSTRSTRGHGYVTCRRALQRGGGGRLYGPLWAGVRASTLLFLPGQSVALVRLGAGTPVPVCLQFHETVHRAGPFLAGDALALAPLAAWVAIRGEIALAPLVLGAAVSFLGGRIRHDLCLPGRRVSTRRRGFTVFLPDSACPPHLRSAALCHAGMVLLLPCLPLVFPGFGRIYLVGIGIIAVLLVYEHPWSAPTSLGRVNQAFFGVNAVVSIGLFFAGTIDLWLQRELIADGHFLPPL